MSCQVQDICEAYEMGFSHGLVFDNLPNHYTGKGQPELYEAYFVGYEKAADRRHEHDDREHK